MNEKSRSASPPSRRAPKKRLQRLLARAEKDPYSVLRDPRCLKPHFCEAFIELCDDKVLTDPGERALQYASIAVDLADMTENPCLMYRSRGVLVHANMAVGNLEEAFEVLDGYHLEAINCCQGCRTNFYMRRADWLMESRLDPLAHVELMRCAEELEPDGDPDSVARMLFVRGIVNNHLFRIAEALADAYYLLRELSLDSPRGYFLDTVAYIAWYVLRSDGSHDEKALEELAALRERIKGLKDWGDVLTRVRWVEGGLYARLGNVRRARKRFEVVCEALFKTGPVRHAVAAALDKLQLLARCPSETNTRAMRTFVSRCQSKLDLDRKLKRRLEKIEDKLNTKPENAPDFLARARASVVSSVPGLV